MHVCVMKYVYIKVIFKITPKYPRTRNRNETKYLKMSADILIFYCNVPIDATD